MPFEDDDELPKIKPRIPASANPMEIPSIASPQMSQMKPAVSLPGVVPTQTDKDQSELNRLKTTGSGISQIHNPVGKTLATIGNVAASLISPGLASRIPGTMEHHNQLVSNQEGIVNNDLKQGKEIAETKKINTPANDKPENPDASAYATLTDQNATPEQRQAALDAIEKIHSAGKTDKETANPQAGYAQAISEALKAGRDPNTDPHVQAWKSAIENVQKEPAANFEEKTYAEWMKTHPQGTRMQFEKESAANKHIVDPQKSDNEDYKRRIEGLKIYQPALDADSRLQTMRQNYNDLIKNHDQQAGLSLLSNHIGMTLGMQKGARITKDFYHEAAASAPWLNRVEAHFDDNGYLSGVVLTPEQAKQMVGLGEQMRKNQWDKAKTAAEYVGIKEAPKSMIQDEAQPQRPANVPEGYIFKDGPKGKGWYKPDAGQK